MKSLYRIIPFLVLAVLLSCKQAPEQIFQQDGVSFMIPTGWKISEQEKIGEGAYYLSLEKDGLDESGVITLSWVRDSMDLQEYLDIYRDEMKGKSVYSTAGIHFGDPQESTFNEIRSASMPFSFSLMSFRHEGVIHVFYGKNKTFTVLRQEALDDKDKNKEGFDKFERSFRTQ